MDYLRQAVKAPANDRRSAMAELHLKKGDLRIEEIASAVDIPFTTCCRNLNILREDMHRQEQA